MIYIHVCCDNTSAKFVKNYLTTLVTGIKTELLEGRGRRGGGWGVGGQATAFKHFTGLSTLLHAMNPEITKTDSEVYDSIEIHWERLR